MIYSEKIFLLEMSMNQTSSGRNFLVSWYSHCSYYTIINYIRVCINNKFFSACK